MIKAAILTVSDSRKKEEDLSGRLLKELLGSNNFEIYSYDIVRDDKMLIKDKLIYYADMLKVDLILTTGGTGLGPRDITPEATLEVLDKQVPGISEFIRAEGLKKTTRSIISRGVSGIRKNTLIVNLPGSPKGSKESLQSILGLIPHAIDMLRGCGH
jgi:molybdenum cofactor synthesis domain-containing protein